MVKRRRRLKGLGFGMEKTHVGRQEMGKKQEPIKGGIDFYWER